MARGIAGLHSVALQWPTIQSNSTRKSRKAMVENQQWSAPGLEQVVELASGILPREFVSADELPGQARQWPTPSANEDAAGTPDGKMQRMLGNHPDVRWPTPASDTGSGGPHGLDGGAGARGMLAGSGLEKSSGALNPDWTECLMAWPIGWTALDPLPELVWPALHGQQVAPPGPYQHAWEPPRVATGVKDRAKRLGCIGNGQHPFAAAMAWRLLSTK